VIPKTLAINAGLDVQETIVKLIEERQASGESVPVGIDLSSGEPFEPKVIVVDHYFKIQKFRESGTMYV
jgi:T-complex protein 1 subunit zeta